MLEVTPYLTLNCEANHLVDHVNRTTIALTFSESAVLSHLLLMPDVICDKDELLLVGWPDRVVALTSLTQCVSTLRKKLEPYPEIQLKTIARRGYQLHILVGTDVNLSVRNERGLVKKAIVKVSLMVKIGVFIVVILLALLGFVSSDYYAVMQEVGKWHADKQIPINIGSTKENAVLIYPKELDSLNPLMWQKLIAPETNSIPIIDSFDAFAFTDGTHYSFASCVTDDKGDCRAEQIINLAALSSTPAGLDMKKFMALSQKMENRIRYNRVLIPPHAALAKKEQKKETEFVEHHYYGDIYFPAANELLVRADFGLSLVYEGDNSGKFYSSTCITDEDCLTTPIKYQIGGQFEQYKEMLDKLEVDVFHVKLTQKNLINPETVSSSAMHFYREIRKDNIRDEELFYYRIHQDKQTSVWIVPLIGNIIVWTKYERVEL